MKRIFTLLLICLLLTGCSPWLKTVRKATTLTENGLLKYESLDWSLEEACEMACKRSLLNNTLKEKATALSLRPVEDINCDCQTEQKNDTRTQQYFKALKAYLKALGKLAGDDLIDVDISNLEGGLEDQGLTEGQAEAVSGITKVASEVLFNQYRKKKLRQHIQEASPHFEALVDYLIADLRDLITKTEAQYSALFVLYRDYKKHLRSVKDPVLLDPYIVRERSRDLYWAPANALLAKKGTILSYIEILEHIKQGHADLLIQQKKPSKKDKTLYSVFQSYYQKLNGLISEF